MIKIDKKISEIDILLFWPYKNLKISVLSSNTGQKGAFDKLYQKFHFITDY